MRGQGQRDGTAGPGELTAGLGRAELSVCVHPQRCPGQGDTPVPTSALRGLLVCQACACAFPLCLCARGLVREEGLENRLRTKTLHHQKASNTIKQPRPCPEPLGQSTAASHCGARCSPRENLSRVVPSTGCPLAGLLGTPPELRSLGPWPEMQGLAGLHPPCGSLRGSLHQG